MSHRLHTKHSRLSSPLTSHSTSLDPSRARTMVRNLGSLAVVVSWRSGREDVGKSGELASGTNRPGVVGVGRFMCVGGERSPTRGDLAPWHGSIIKKKNLGSSMRSW